MPVSKTFNPVSDVNLVDNSISIPNHGFVNSQGVVYNNNNGNSVGGLVSGFKYYVIFVNLNTIKLANTEVEARAGTAVDLIATGTGSNHTITNDNTYPNSAAYYDFFRKFRFIGTGIVDPDGYTIEADNVRDTLTIIGGDNIVFSDPSTGPIDTITINGPDYDIYSPTGVSNGASIRLENTGVESQDLKLTSFRGIRIDRVANNEIEFESFGVTETDTLHTVTSRGNLTSNDLVMNNLLVGKIQSTPGIDGFINVSVSSGDAFTGNGTLDDPLVFSPDESQRTDAVYTVTLNFSSPSPGTLNYVAIYRSSAALTTGYVQLERQNPSTLAWEILDYLSGTLTRTSYEIQNIYAELDAGPVNYRIKFDWTGNTEYVNYRVRLTYEVEPIAGNEIILTDTDTEVLTLGTSSGTVNLRGTIGIVETLNFEGIRIFENNIDGNTSNSDINIRPNGTGDLVVIADTDISGDLTVRGGDIITDKTTFNLLNTTVTTVNAFGAANTAVIATNASSIQLGNFTLNGSVIDTDDSSGIVFVPAVTLNSDLNVENDIRVTQDLFVTGNTEITQDLFVTGSTEITGSLTVGGGILGNSTLTVDSNAIFKSDVEIRGGDLTTDQTTFNLLNTTATTINAFGAATTANIAAAGTVVSIGAPSGTTTVNNNLTVTGDLTVNGTTTTLNTTTLDVEDLNITVAKGALNATAANGAGLSVDGASATLLYASSNDSWNFNKLLTATSLQNTPIGTTTRAAGNFTTLDANSTVGLSPANASVTISPTGTGTVTINPVTAGTINNISIGSTTASTGRFTTLEVRDTTTTNFDLFFASNSSVALTADRTLTIDVENANRTISLAGNIDIANNFSTSGNFALTLTTTGITNVTLPTSGTLAITGSGLNQFASTTSSQLAGVISDETGSGSLVFGTSPVIATPDINAGTVDSLTSLSVRDTSAAFDVTLVATSNPALTAGRTLTFNVENANRSIALGGNIDTANDFNTSGNFALTLTTTAATNVTLPTTGTLATTGNLSQFAATTSAQLAGVISDETGSGSLVFGTNPSLTSPTFGNTSVTAANADFLVLADQISLASWIAGFTGITRTLQIGSLTAGRKVQVYIRNIGGTITQINVTASTTTVGFSAVNLAGNFVGANAAGQISATSVTLAATSGTAVITVWNANGNIVGMVV